MIGLTEAEELSLAEAGLSVPSPCVVTALFDTGASWTSVAPELIEYLGASPRGFATVTASGGDSVDLPLYSLRVWPEDLEPPFYIQAVPVRPATRSVLMLIGRDILDQCEFHYDGPKRVFSLWF